MKIQQIRNATLWVEYAGVRFLIDPFLAEKGTYAPFPNSLRQEQKNPLVDLPISLEEVLTADAVIVTHLHLDHWDETAANTLPKDIPLFTQNKADAAEIKKQGFTQVSVLDSDSSFEEIQLIKTAGEHGRGDILAMAGSVCGVVFKHTSETILYIAGDTVWYPVVEQNIQEHKPEVIVVNAGDNQFLQGGSLVMGKEDVQKTAAAAPNATILTSHMEAVNHWTLSRQELRDFLHANGLEKQVLVPEDGETYSF